MTCGEEGFASRTWCESMAASAGANGSSALQHGSQKGRRWCGEEEEEAEEGIDEDDGGH